jgi:hypothetical protein
METVRLLLFKIKEELTKNNSIGPGRNPNMLKESFSMVFSCVTAMALSSF